MPTSERRLRMRKASEIESVRTEWLLDQRIPLGEVTLLAGMPGEGKTMYLCQLAARISRGTDGGERGTVLYATGEDAFDKTLKPRLVAAGADLDRVVFIDAVEVEGDSEAVTGSFHLPNDANALIEAVEAAQPRLLIIDPLSAHVSEGVDSWKDESARRAMKPLTLIAQQYGCAVVVAHHTNKRGEADAIVRVGGSLGGIAGPVRSIFLWGVDKADAGYRLLYHVKHNLSEKQPMQVYAIETERVKLDDGTRQAVAKTVLVGEDSRGQEAILGGDSGSKAPATDAAVEFLKQELAEGPIDAKQVLADANANGISKPTLERAAKVLHVWRHPEGSPGHGGKWVWELPAMWIKINRRKGAA
jgi:hypothetical protein